MMYSPSPLLGMARLGAWQTTAPDAAKGEIATAPATAYVITVFLEIKFAKSPRLVSAPTRLRRAGDSPFAFQCRKPCESGADTAAHDQTTQPRRPPIRRAVIPPDFQAPSALLRHARQGELAPGSARQARAACPDQRGTGDPLGRWAARRMGRTWLPVRRNHCRRRMEDARLGDGRWLAAARRARRRRSGAGAVSLADAAELSAAGRSCQDNWAGRNMASAKDVMSSRIDCRGQSSFGTRTPGVGQPRRHWSRRGWPLLKRLRSA